MKRKAFRFTLLGVLAVSLFAGAAAPRGTQRKLVDHMWPCVDTWSDMLGLQTAIEAYGVDHPTYPRAKTMEELRDLIQPAYIAEMPMHDAWGTPYRYVVSVDGAGFLLVSAGSDKTFEENTWKTPAFLSESARDSVRTSEGWATYREWVIQP